MADSHRILLFIRFQAANKFILEKRGKWSSSNCQWHMICYWSTEVSRPSPFKSAGLQGSTVVIREEEKKHVTLFFFFETGSHWSGDALNSHYSSGWLELSSPASASQLPGLWACTTTVPGSHHALNTNLDSFHCIFKKAGIPGYLRVSQYLT